jgi:hypothetical protein
MEIEIKVIEAGSVLISETATSIEEAIFLLSGFEYEYDARQDANDE